MSDSPDLPEDPLDAVALARDIGKYAAPFAAQHDRESTFVTEGYQAIRELGYGAIAVPKELGGAGHNLTTVCRAQAALARGCANTSLAIAMHQHNVLNLAWRWTQGDSEVEPILQRVAEGMILCSSGVMDLAKPGVTATRAPGGLRVTGKKGLASGGPGSDVLATLVALDDDGTRSLITALVPLDSPGVSILDTWNAMGMRGSGSNGIDLRDVFVPSENIIGIRVLGPSQPGETDAAEPATTAGVRPAKPAPERAVDPHRMPGLLLAVTVISSVYLGAAGGVRDLALTDVKRGRRADDPITHRLAGLMTHEWQLGWWALEGLLRATTDESLGSERHFVTTMLAKRQTILSSIAVVETAMQMLGSMSYMKDRPYEQALRDVRAGITHPLAPEATLSEVGRSALQRHG